MTPSESFVFNLCQNTFLSFWSFLSPKGKKGKELCDILVVCDPDKIIISVKDINVYKTVDYITAAERWQKKAVDDSVKQIYGAERILALNEAVLLSDGITTIKLPENGIRNIYRIAVAFGNGKNFPIYYGEYGKGYVHVFDETSIQVVMRELDTITDFTEYLTTTEAISAGDTQHIGSSVEDYLALHLMGNLHMKSSADFMIVGDDLWEGYSNSTDYKKLKERQKNSYLWDNLLEGVSKDFSKGELITNISRNNLELAIRLMNRESRFEREGLSRMLKEVLGDGVQKPSVKSRITKRPNQNPDTPIYVFMSRSYNEREQAVKELQLRMIVARSLFEEGNFVIGIASEPYQIGKGYSLDICYLNLSGWDNKWQKEAELIKNDLGYFSSPSTSYWRHN